MRRYDAKRIFDMNERTNIHGIPVIAFAAYSGEGKTTLIEKLIAALKERGLRLAVIKHDGHDFEIDREGKDSWRFAKAGADITIVSSASKTAYIQNGSLTLDELLDIVHEVDIILVEGYKNQALPRIGIARSETGRGFAGDISSFIALVTDMKIETKLPCFALNDIDGICGFIMKRISAA